MVFFEKEVFWHGGFLENVILACGLFWWFWFFFFSEKVILTCQTESILME